MQRKPEPLLTRRDFWLRWVVAHVAGATTGLAAAAPVWLIALGIDNSYLGFLTLGLAGTLVGLCIGYAQWAALRRPLTSLRRWLYGSAVGGFFALPTLGVSMGLGQWMVLPPGLSRSVWWIAASTAGLWLGGLIGGFLWGPFGGGVLSGVIAGILGGAVMGSITGLALRLAIRLHPPGP